MIDLIFNIGNITGGILLGLATLDKWDGERNFFNKIAGFLAPFQTIIGVGLVVLGLMKFSLVNLISVLGGLVLLTHVLGKVPALGVFLEKISKKIIPYKAIIGIILIVLGVLGLF